jgi:aspartate 4-decarboxylase
MSAEMVPTPRARQQELARLSPFELKDVLITLASESARQSAGTLLNAGRGNPNWVATEAREAFLLLGRFALLACRATRDDGILAGLPRREGIAAHLGRFLDDRPDEPGASFVRAVLAFGTSTLGFEADAFVHELADGVVGDHYPSPDRMLPHAERIVHAYLHQELCGGAPPPGRFDLFAVEGGAAAMCYVFDSLQHNGLLAAGDRVAILQPIFTPYLEITALERFRFEVVALNAVPVRSDGTDSWHFPPSELAKLADPSIRMLVCVNPSNPPSQALGGEERSAIVRAVREGNPDLVIVTDDVYATFVPGFRSLLADLPANCIAVYSFSKHFGATGWRLGVVAVHEDNVMDRRIARLPPEWSERLARRYGSLTLEPQRLRFIDRMVADSRDVALNHTAGLSTPQQVQMALFALTHLLDATHAYRDATIRILHHRRDLLWQGIGLRPPPDDPERAWYYVTLDLEAWARRSWGDAFFAHLCAHHEPVDFVFRLAEQSGIVLLHGGGFGGPPWSVRVSLANLDDADYACIGSHMREAMQAYVEEWRAA